MKSITYFYLVSKFVVYFNPTPYLQNWGLLCGLHIARPLKSRRRQRRDFYVSAAAPLWADCYPRGKDRAKKFVEYLGCLHAADSSFDDVKLEHCIMIIRHKRIFLI